jgi:hypothetical protein
MSNNCGTKVRGKGRCIDDVVLDAKRRDRLVPARMRDHAGRNVDSGYPRSALRHLAREITVAATDVEETHFAHVAAQRDLRRAEELVSIIIAPCSLPGRIRVGGVVPRGANGFGIELRCGLRHRACALF